MIPFLSKKQHSYTFSSVFVIESKPDFLTEEQGFSGSRLHPKTRPIICLLSENDFYQLFYFHTLNYFATNEV